MVVLPNIRRKYMVSRLPQGATVDIAECLVSLATDSVPYTGSARTVGVTVTWDGATLSLNTDYTLSYANNTNVGPATVTVTGMGQFIGSVTKTFYITSAAAAGWDNIDLANTADAGSAASLSVVSGVLHLQTLADGRLFFVDDTSHKMYLWGFGSGHPFEVAHFKAEPDSVSDAVSNAQMGAITTDGMTVAYSQTSWGYFWTRPLSVAFDLSTLGSQTEQRLTPTNHRIHIARDGLHVVLKGKNSPDMYSCSCTAPHNLSSLSIQSSCNMSNYASGTWRDFVFSEDGAVLLAVVDGSVKKIALSTPWDVGTGVLKSSFTPTGLTGYIEGIAVSGDASKMVLFSTGDGKFHEYDLSA